MTNTLTSPNWTKKLSHANRKLTRQCERELCVHAIKVEAETVTFHELSRKVLGATSTFASALDRIGVAEDDKWKLASQFFDQLHDLRPNLWQTICTEAAREFKKCDRVEELSVGPVCYQLRSPVRATVEPCDGHMWAYSVEQFSPRFVGKGVSIAAAKRDFLNSVHSVFQSLVRMRSFQMNDTQLSDWKLLEDLIDVNKYWDAIPVTLFEIGVISSVKADVIEIAWLDGERKELVTIDRTPPEFAAFCEGQWFEALVERQPKTYHLRKVAYVRTINPVRGMTDDDFRQWVDSLQTDIDLPKSETNWATL